MKYGFLTLIILIFFLTGIHYDSLAYQLYLFGALLGLIFLCFQRVRFSFLSKAMRTYLFWLFIFGVYVFISIVQVDFSLLFDFRFETIIIMLTSPLFAIYCHYTINQFTNKNQLFWIVLLSAGFACFVFLMMLMVDYDNLSRSTGLLQDPIDRGNKGMLFGLILLPIFMSDMSFKTKALSMIAMLSGISISLISQSRGGWLALVMAIFSMMLFLYRFNHKKSLVVTGLFFSALLIVIILMAPYHQVDERIVIAYNEIMDYFNDAQGKHTSVGARLELWKISTHMITENFWLGSGWDSFDQVHHLYNLRHPSAEKIRFFGHPHNQFLYIFVELGLVGLIMYLMIFICPAYLCCKQIMQQGSLFSNTALIALSTLIMIESITEFNLTNDVSASKVFMLIFVIVNILALLTYCQKKPQKT